MATNQMHQGLGQHQNKGMIAYFSMEIGLDAKLPTYSGGLGVLAGDTLQSAADLSCPMVAVSLLYRAGYYHQDISEQGQQQESPVKWFPEDLCKRLNETITIEIEGRQVTVQAYRYDVKGVGGHILPVYFLDTDIEGNSEVDRALTKNLYGGEEKYRLSQETLLGMGGVAYLEKLGHAPTNLTNNKETAQCIRRYHMNEGHAALLTLQLMKRRLQDKNTQQWTVEDQQWVREHCLFTTHTPVPAGHDTFSRELTEQILGKKNSDWLDQLGGYHDGRFNVSYIAMNLSNYINGVAKRHAEVSRKLLNNETIQPITNGVHLGRWISSPVADLFDNKIPGWRADNFYVRNMFDVSAKEVAAAHALAKKDLFEKIKQATQVTLDPSVFTIGFARRATEYKRATLLFEDVAALKQLAKTAGAFQLVFAGKAHPKDMGGKKLIESLYKHAADLKTAGITMVYIPNYDMNWGRAICAGVDIWLNTPLKPLEASGTSGMKASLNGVPNLSTLDGWWVEGCIEGVTGWEIEDPADAYVDGSVTPANRIAAAKNLYKKLGEQIMPMYYKQPNAWQEVMKNAITVNASYFNTHRMVLQYMQNAY